MKKLILVALAFVAIQATAQEQKREHKKGDHQQGQTFADLSAEEIATIQTKKMTLRLDLNDSQQREIQKINLEEAITRKARMEERKAKKEGDKAEKPSKENRVATMNKMLDHKIEVKAKMKKILNDEQYVKWEADQEKRYKNRKGNRKSHRGEGEK